MEVLGSQIKIPKNLKNCKIKRRGGGKDFGISKSKGWRCENVHAPHGRVWIFSGITQQILNSPQQIAQLYSGCIDQNNVFF